MDNDNPTDKPAILPARNHSTQWAASCASDQIPSLLHSTEPEVLRALLGNPQFREQEVLLLLNRKNLTQSTIEELAGHKGLISSYGVKLALAKHPKTPAWISLAQLKFLYVFDLVTICLLPALSSGLKRAAEESILGQAAKLAVGQRITLAKLGPARIAASLLVDENPQIIEAVLDNPYISEHVLLQVLNRPECSAQILNSISSHPKWSSRYDIRLALLRQPNFTMARSLKILPRLRTIDLKQLCQDSAVIPEIRRYVSRLVDLRKSR